MDFKDLIIYNRTIPKREACYAAFPQKLKEELVQYLKNQGIERLYTHQAEMFEQAQEGKHIVITTSTASGKTLAFLLPVLQNLL